VAGVAFERDAFEPTELPAFGYSHEVPGVFVQDDVDLTAWLSVSASGRIDAHSEYGTFVSPRVSALVEAGGWTSRTSFGGGFFAPTPLTEETEAAGLTRLQVPAPLEPERGASVSWDVTRRVGPGSYTATVFASRVRHPLSVERGDRYALVNLPNATTAVGIDLLAALRREPVAVTATYTYVRSRETLRGEAGPVALTPTHSAGVVGMWESDEGRVGVECYYTGVQRLEENPYRARSRPYVVLGALVERRVGPVRLFLNAENLTDVRQTRWDPLVRPARAVDGRWTVDAWAPLEGRVFNGGARIAF
jgi:iron complex outermembrane receptor protein